MAGDRDPQQNEAVEVPEDALKPGDQLFHGQYRIEKYLSAGGFGITYLAVDSLKRKVVIKECFPNTMCCRSQGVVRTRASSHQKEFQAVVRDFGQEALRMANLKHPNIVGVHQVFEDNNTAYMALDFVQGQELLEVIEKDRDRLNPAEIKRILLQLLDAIAYIHERDVVHRDIAPDNILLDTSGNPVLIDFGAAREVATRASRALSALQIVKDGYSPQEFYVTNGMQTASSDIYSLAATFYHLITGAPPPNSQVRLAALAADERDPYIPIPPRTEGYDHFFLGAIDKGLAVFPKHRLQSAVAWIEEIDQVRRQLAMAERAKKDEAITLSIRQLTVETNKALQAGERKKPRVPLRHIPASLVKASSSVAPKPAEAKAVANKPPAATEQAAAVNRPAAPAQAPVPKADRTPEKVHSKPLGSSPEPAAVKARLKPRRRSLLNRIVSVPVWLFASGRQSVQNKNGGFEQ